jgi:Raf kinase inhibitor-like YbhB/YbcL family protein
MRARRLPGLCVPALLLLAGVVGARAAGSLTVFSPAFASGQPIPARYALAGENIPPELRVREVPASARSLALIVDDPDAPAGLWTHWLVWNLPAGTTVIPEGKLPEPAREGKNSFGRVRYDGPAPPAGTGVHRYFFCVYALDAPLVLPGGADRAALLDAMRGHVVGAGETFGTCQYEPALSP